MIWCRKMVFDPKLKKEIFYEFKLNYMENESKIFDSAKPMGNIALHFLDDIISGLLVQLKNEVEKYLPTVHKWLDFSIARKEQFGEGDDLIFYHAQLFRGKALASWVSDNFNEVHYWEKARLLWSNFDGSSRSIYAKSKYKTEFLDDYLQLCIQSDNYFEGISRFEKYYGKKDISINTKMTPREYGYLLCVNHFDSKYSRDELVSAGEKMLTKYMGEPWLSMGLYSYAATWLKIVYWDNSNTQNVLDTISKAYKCCPDIDAV